MSRTFGTVLNCMDGRIQLPVIEWMKKTYRVDYVDSITEAGAEKAIVDGPEWQVDSIKSRVLISINKHGSKIIAIISHHDCAGNPVSKEEHIDMTLKAIDVVKSWNLNVEVIGLWVDENWHVEVVSKENDE